MIAPWWGEAGFKPWRMLFPLQLLQSVERTLMAVPSVPRQEGGQEVM